MMPRTLWKQAASLVVLGRPLHLLGGALFYSLGAATAVYVGAALNWVTALGSLLAMLGAQLMAHYSNDFFDFDADLANPNPTQWSGGSRVLPAGHLPPQVALIASLVFGMLGLFLILWFAPQTPAPGLTLVVFLVAAFFAWSYSSPPIWLNRRRLGELFGAVTVPGSTLLLGFVVQRGSLELLPLLVAVPLCLMQFGQLVTVNVPDAEGDRLVGKHTLIVWLGPDRMRGPYLAVLALAYLTLPIVMLAGLPWPVALAVLITTPIALWLGFQVIRGAWHKPATWDALGFWSIGLIVGTALCQFGAFLLLL
ncbi:prenyltransferase [Candidatus Chloroploca sp. Khr17]|uniref:prenyltransferase n=1 Tax=Candidatus Chloroploca sp. Khr17 TaxID=2496869 RepID=UPI001F0D5684|nr:prenyltransferase [Candidatus Chloroploca sp. Khr17]